MLAWLRAWTVPALFLAFVATELAAAFVPALRMRTLTRAVVTYLPWPVTDAIVVWLSAWLLPHFADNYRRKGVDMLDPNRPQPSEPLLLRAGVVAGVVAVVDLLVAFGVHINTAQDVAILGVTNAVVVPLALAVWARRSVFSPATVARMLKAKGAAPSVPPAPGA